MKNKYIHYGVVLLIIAGISAGVLAFVNGKTSPIIAANNAKKDDVARKQVLAAAEKFDVANAKEIKGAKKGEELTFIPGLDKDGKVIGYVVKVNQGGGYAGSIGFILGIDNNSKVTGLAVTDQGETAGLGARVTEKTWADHWIGTDESYKFNKKVDAFGGATISPTCVYNGIIRALKAFNEVKK